MFENCSFKKIGLNSLLSAVILILIASLNPIRAQFVPDLIYPNNNEVTKENNITFKWNKDVQQSLTYQFQLTTNPTFSSVIIDQSTTSNSFFVSGLSNYSQMHYWRVRSSQGPIISNWSAVDSFYLFMPTSISGLSVWLDPNTGVVLNGVNVQNMSDNTTNLNNAGQVSTSQQPIYIGSDSLINNKSILRFDGINDFMEIADNSTIDFTNQFSMFVLVKPTIIATNKTIMAKWDYQTQGSWAWQTDFSTSNQLQFSPAVTITDPGNQSIKSTNADMVLLKPTLLNLCYNGNLTNKVQFYKNSNLLNSVTSGSLPSTLPNSTATLKIGKYGGIATRYYQGDIGEILIYNSELLPSQKTIVESYLRYKYAPPVSLGPDTLTNQNTVCTNITLRAQSKYQTYLWSGGSTASSLNVTQPGEYWVTVTDFLGNISTDTINVYSIVIPAPTFTGICVNEAAVWNADMGPGFTYLWSTGPTTPSLSITSAGTYSVIVSDAFGCSRSSGSYTINVDTYSQTAYLGNDTTLCANNLIALQSGAAETVSYIWPTVTPNDQANYSVVTTGDYWVETTNVNGCVARDTINVTVSGVAPIADFSFLGQCQNANVAFTDGSAPIGADLIASWTWDMGEGTVLSAQDPGHTYTTPGIYTVELYVESIGGCGAFHTETVTVFAAPIANFSYTGYCAEYAIPFTNLSVNGSAPIADYFWDFDMPWTGTYNNSVVSAPNRIFPSASTYLVSLQVTDTNGCVSDTVLPVLIDPTPIVDFSYNPACENSAIQFTNLSTSESSSTISWNFGDNTYSILTNPSKTFQDFGLQLVTLQVTNPNGCVGEKQHQVEVFPNPVALLDHGPSCKGSYVSLDNVSTIPLGSIDSTIWIINSIDTLYGASVSYLLNTLGQNNFQLITYSEHDCRSEVNEFVDVTIELNASFTAGTGLVAAGSPFSFVNTSTSNSASAVASLWFFDDGQFSSDYSPEHVFDTQYIDSTLYPYLIIMNTEGCIDTAFQTIYLKRGELDLSLTNVYLEQQGNFSIVGVKMKNRGTVNIEKAELKLESTKGLLFQEVWTGEILPNAEYIYIFNAAPLSTYSDQNEQDAFICVNGIGYNALGVAETYLGNNYECENIEGTAVILMPVVPNPAVDQIELGIIVSEANEVVIDLYDALGKKVQNLLPSATWEIGTHRLLVDIRSVQNGVYFVRMNSGGKIVNEKILISNN